MEIPIILPTTLYGWIGIIAIVIASIVYIRQQKIKGIYDANKELRQIVNDKVKEIEEMKVQIASLQDQVHTLQKANKTLEDLVLTALKQYFFENPKIAGDMKTLIAPTQ